MKEQMRQEVQDRYFKDRWNTLGQQNPALRPIHRWVRKQEPFTQYLLAVLFGIAILAALVGLGAWLGPVIYPYEARY